MFPIPSLAGDDEEERRSWGGCGCVDVAPTRGIPTNFACANGMDQWIHATDMKGGVAMVARARGGFHHGMDPDKPPAAIFNISSYFSLWIFVVFGCRVGVCGPSPTLPAEPPTAPVEFIAKAPPAGPSTSSRQYRRAVQSAISSPFLARLPPSSPSTVDTRHWMEIPRACRSSKTLQRMLRASATSETVHGPNRAIRRMRGCRAPLTPSGHDVFAAGCACPGGTSCSRLTGSKVSV